MVRFSSNYTWLLNPPHLYRLPKIKAWIDANNPGDPLIPFSVALEDRLAQMSSAEERREEETKIGAQSALGKITQAGYSSLDVRLFCCGVKTVQCDIVCIVDTVLYVWSR